MGLGVLLECTSATLLGKEQCVVSPQPTIVLPTAVLLDFKSFEPATPWAIACFVNLKPVDASMSITQQRKRKKTYKFKS